MDFIESIVKERVAAHDEGLNGQDAYKQLENALMWKLRRPSLSETNEVFDVFIAVKNHLSAYFYEMGLRDGAELGQVLNEADKE